MRSKDERIDVSAICQTFGGGGHTLAAGARVLGTLAEVEQKVLEEIDETVRRAGISDGVLLVDKAEGMTSHDVVALARRQLGTRKIGHCGTLDPIATGLLLLTVGRGTKVQDLLMSEDKEYAGTFALGITTDTQDREGEVIQRRPVPALNEHEIRATFEKFRGDFYQLPPMVSAKKQGGVPLL